MRFEEETLELSRINLTDHTYRITTGPGADGLVSSLQSVGLMNPPILVHTHSKFTIVCGFRRIAAWQHLEYSHIRARVVASITTAMDCTKLAIADNALQRPLNLIEKSRSYDMLSRFYPDDESLSRASTSLGLNDDTSLITRIKKLCRYPLPIQNGILCNTISLAMAGELGELEPETGVAFANLFSDLKLSLNKQREIITLVKEIALRERVSILDVIHAEPFNKLVKNDDADRTQKTRDIRFYLKQRRFPAITRAEETFQSGLKKLKLGKGAKLIHPENFEGTDYILNLYFTNLEELKERKATLDRLIRDPHLIKILK